MYIKKSEERIGVTLKYTRARARVKKKIFKKELWGESKCVTCSLSTRQTEMSTSTQRFLVRGIFLLTKETGDFVR